MEMFQGGKICKTCGEFPVGIEHNCLPIGEDPDSSSSSKVGGSCSGCGKDMTLMEFYHHACEGKEFSSHDTDSVTLEQDETLLSGALDQALGDYLNGSCSATELAVVVDCVREISRLRGLGQ